MNLHNIDIIFLSQYLPRCLRLKLDSVNPKKFALSESSRLEAAAVWLDLIWMQKHAKIRKEKNVKKFREFGELPFGGMEGLRFFEKNEIEKFSILKSLIDAVTCIGVSLMPASNAFNLAAMTRQKCFAATLCNLSFSS